MVNLSNLIQIQERSQALSFLLYLFKKIAIGKGSNQTIWFPSNPAFLVLNQFIRKDSKQVLKTPTHFLYGKKSTFNFTDRDWHLKTLKSSNRNQISDHHRYTLSLLTAQSHRYRNKETPAMRRFARSFCRNKSIVNSPCSATLHQLSDWLYTRRTTEEGDIKFVPCIKSNNNSLENCIS